MTQEERDLAEHKHDLVIDFLRYRRLPIDEFYDIVIFGCLSAVQQYFRNPPTGVEFKAMAFRAVKGSALREKAYNSCAKRCGITVNLDEIGNVLTDPRQDTERQVEDKILFCFRARAAVS